jgi:hypothetical protein
MKLKFLREHTGPLIFHSSPQRIVADKAKESQVSPQKMMI